MFTDNTHLLETKIIQNKCIKNNSRVIIIDFNNILLSFYYQFIDMLSKFILTNFFSDIENIDKLHNIILINFIKYNFLYFLRAKLQQYNISSNYQNFIYKYINYLKKDTCFSEKTINYIEQFLTKNTIVPNKDPTYFNNEYIKLINYVIVFILLKLFFIEFKENITFNEIIIIIVLRDDISSKNNFTHFFDFISQFYKSKTLNNTSSFLTNILNIPVSIIIKYVRNIEGSSIKTEIDDLHCINTFIDIYNKPCTNVILFSNDKYRKILSANFKFLHETLTFTSFSDKIIYNKFTLNDIALILNKLKTSKYLEVYTSSNIKYKDYKFGQLNALNLDKYKKIISYFIEFIKKNN